MAGATAALAAFALELRLEQVPEPALAAARRSLLDTLGVALAAGRLPLPALLADFCREQGAAPRAGIWGTASRTSPALAAFANSTLSHALDFDDASLAAQGHSTAVVLPALLALAEAEGAGGAEVLAAYVAGHEAAAKLGLVLNPALAEAGWHAMPVLGVLAATVALGRLRGLDAGQLRAALGIAASSAGGLRQNFGTTTKALHAGRAAREAMTAVDLARRGATGDATVLEAAWGVGRMFAGVPDGGWTAFAASLGHPFDLAAPGPLLKLYPSCAHTHAAIDAAFWLAEEYALQWDQVVRIECQVLPLTAEVCRFTAPETGEQARFSLTYCVAAAIHDRYLRLVQFDDDLVNRRTVRHLMEKVEVAPALDAEIDPAAGFPARVRIELRDGREVEERVEAARGTPANPLSDQEVQGKFRDCTRGFLSPDDAAFVIQSVARFQDLPDLRPLLRVLQAG